MRDNSWVISIPFFLGWLCFLGGFMPLFIWVNYRSAYVLIDAEHAIIHRVHLLRALGLGVYALPILTQTIYLADPATIGWGEVVVPRIWWQYIVLLRQIDIGLFIVGTVLLAMSIWLEWREQRRRRWSLRH